MIFKKYFCFNCPPILFNILTLVVTRKALSCREELLYKTFMTTKA